MNTRLKNITRIISIVAGVLLLTVIFVPIWRIELSAPQYPEGLTLQIFANKLGGDVEVINGLNHYIGMRTLHTDDFVEFSVLPYIIGLLGVFGILTALVNRKWFYITWLGSISLFGIIALVDFYRWNYNYGHNLNPEAPIKVPGMSYQPPLIGYKQLLNFGAYSIPDIGGWLFIGAYVILLASLYLEIRNILKAKQSLKPAYGIFLVFFLMQSCSSGPRPVKAGTDACTFCKMTVTDDRFAAELVTSTGKIFVFDDLNCLKGYQKEHTGKNEQGTIYVVNYADHQMIPAAQAFYVKSEQLHSPMGSNTVACRNSSEASALQQSKSGTILHWEELNQ